MGVFLMSSRQHSGVVMKKPRATPVAISLSLLLALASSLWSIPSLEAQTDPFYKGKMI